MQTAPDVATARRIFDRLAEGGEVTMPLVPAFGMTKDRFGTAWMITVAPAA